MHIEQVKRYVLTTLLCSVVMLHSLAMAALGVTVQDKGGARQGLFVISLLLGVVAIGASRLIFGKSFARAVLTPWLLCAAIIPVATYWLVLWR